MVMELLYILSLIVLFLTTIFYSKEGDIDVLIGKFPNTYKLRKKYNNKNKIIKRLHELTTYKYENIKWNRFLSISIVVASIIVYFYRKRIILSEMFMISVVIFLAIDLPHRWFNTHLTRNVTTEAMLLRSLIK